MTQTAGQAVRLSSTSILILNSAATLSAVSESGITASLRHCPSGMTRAMIFPGRQAQMDGDQKAAWLSARCGKLTASRMADAMDFLKSGQPSAKRVKLMQELLAERLTGDSMSHVVTEAMEHGIEYEDEAVDMFVGLTGRD